MMLYQFPGRRGWKLDMDARALPICKYLFEVPHLNPICWIINQFTPISIIQVDIYVVIEVANVTSTVSSGTPLLLPPTSNPPPLPPQNQAAELTQRNTTFEDLFKKVVSQQVNSLNFHLWLHEFNYFNYYYYF